MKTEKWTVTYWVYFLFFLSPLLVSIKSYWLEKQNYVKSVTLGTMGSLHGTPQPPAALCNHQQPHWPFEAPCSIPQPPSMAYCSCLGLTHKKECLEIKLAQKNPINWKFTMLTFTPRHQTHFKIIWMFYIYLTIFSREIRRCIVGAENHFQPKFYDLINIYFLHGFPFDSIFTIYLK
jgi:hypothetical protein